MGGRLWGPGGPAQGGGGLPPTPLTALLRLACRVIPRARLEQAAQHGVGLAYACMWLPAWGDSCLDDAAGVPVGELHLVPDCSGARHLPLALLD